MTDMIFTHHYAGRESVERVVVIEYHREWRVHGRWIPFSVTTESGQYKTACEYDFEYTANRGLQCHCSGFGGRAQAVLARYCKPKPPPAKLWVAPGLSLVTCDLKPRSLTPRQVLQFGYCLVPQPLSLPKSLGTWDKGITRNPFEAAEETYAGFIYCSTCNAYYDRDDYCDHMTWCDECCAFVNEKHVPEDSCDGKPVSHEPARQ